MLEKIGRVKLSEEVLRRLKEMIQSGQFGYGDKLPVEKRLSEIFGVSRTTLREALAILAAEGWVAARQGGGTYVKKAGIPESVKPLTTFAGDQNVAILEVMELRKILECEVAMLAASRATAEDITALKLTHQKMTDDILRGRLTMESDYQFHFLVAKATQNSTILKMVTALHDQFDEIVRTNSHHGSKPDDYARVLTEHDAIIKAIEKRQGSMAKRQMGIHLESTQRLLEETLIGET